MKRIWQQIINKTYMILPIITLLCFAGFIGSLIFPNPVLDTVTVNMTEDEDDTEFLVDLKEGMILRYEMNTSSNPMRGIQIGIHKQGMTQDGTMLYYNVYQNTGNGETLGSLLSENTYDVGQGMESQYVYLPFNNYKACVGDIVICFYAENDSWVINSLENVYPAVLMNHTLIDNTKTMLDSEVIEGSLKGNYIYTHNTYPFLYDMRLLSFIFLAATMTVCFPKRKNGGKA